MDLRKTKSQNWKQNYFSSLQKITLLAKINGFVWLEITRIYQKTLYCYTQIYFYLLLMGLTDAKERIHTHTDSYSHLCHCLTK